MGFLMFQDAQNEHDILTKEETVSDTVAMSPILPPVIPNIPVEESIQKDDEPQSYPSFLSEAHPYTTPFSEEDELPTNKEPENTVEDKESEERFMPQPPTRPVVSVIPPETVISEERTEPVSLEIPQPNEQIQPTEKTALPESEVVSIPEIPTNSLTFTSPEKDISNPEIKTDEFSTLIPKQDTNVEQTVSEQSSENNTSNDTQAQTETLETTVENSELPKEEEVVLDYRSEKFLADLFSKGNECVTTASGSFPIKDDTRTLLALFTNGRFFVSESAKFDGKVLGFEYLARRRRLQIGKPEYVPSIVINDIYEYAARNTSSKFIPPTAESDTQEQVRMQRDFVTIVSQAALKKVSDIHIVVADHTTVMFRYNGLMQTEMEYNKEWGESFVRAAFASSDISDANYAQNEYQAAQKLGRTPLRGSGGRLVLPRNVLGIRLQFNPIAFGSRYVIMRLLYAEDDIVEASNLGTLGFSPKECDLFYRMRSFPTGIIVISGPTGSGKSTTLQRNMISMLRERNYEINLITVEDPPEYPIPGARQMPVTNAMIEEAKEREFTKALSAALRSDPDALMIGEIRTLSAADLAFRGALSGHNVWTTLHANDAASILMRLKDIGVEDFKLRDPSIVKGMMAQRLFRKACPYCRIKAADQLNHPAVQRLRQAFGDIALERSFLRGPGCEFCDFRGVSGRTVIGEFILPDATLLDLSVRGEAQKAMNYWINDLEGVTLRENAITRMLDGVIDIEEVEKWTGLLDQPVLA